MEYDRERYSGKLSAFGIGILFMIVALIVQEIIESMPTIYLLYIRHISLTDLSTVLFHFEKTYIIEYSIFIGMIAGFCQEFAKYVAVDTRKASRTIYIGLGFSAVDLAVLFLPVLLVRPAFTDFSILLLSFNVILSLLFHPSTAMLLKWGRVMKHQVPVFLLALFSHSLIDGGLVFTDIRVIENVTQDHTYSLIYWAMALAVTAIILIIALRLFPKTDERQVAEKPVVY